MTCPGAEPASVSIALPSRSGPLPMRHGRICADQPVKDAAMTVSKSRSAKSAKNKTNPPLANGAHGPNGAVPAIMVAKPKTSGAGVPEPEGPTKVKIDRTKSPENRDDAAPSIGAPDDGVQVDAAAGVGDGTPPQGDMPQEDRGAVTADDAAIAENTAPQSAPRGVASGLARAVGTSFQLAVSAIVGAFLGVLLMDSLQFDGVPAPVDTRLRDVEARLEAAGLANGDPQLASTIRTELAEIRDRMNALEGLRRDLDQLVRAGAPGPELGAVESAITDLNASLGQIETRLAQLSGEVTRGQARLQDRVSSLEGAVPPNLARDLAAKADSRLVGDLETRVGALERNDAGQNARRSALAVALANLTRAAYTGQSFATELEAVESLVADDPSMPSLKAYAENGILSLETLQAQFGDVARDVVRAWHMAGHEGVLGRLWANLLATVTVRPVGDVEGDTPPAVVARAEMRLAEDNLAAAMEELTVLTGEPAAAVAPWLAQAQARLNLDGLIRELNTQVIVGIAAQTAPVGQRAQTQAPVSETTAPILFPVLDELPTGGLFPFEP